MVKEFITRKEAAKLLKISLPTLQEYTKSGIIKGRYQCGRRVLYDKNQLVESLSAFRVAKYQRSAV